MMLKTEMAARVTLNVIKRRTALVGLHGRPAVFTFPSKRRSIGNPEVGRLRGDHARKARSRR
jgi:hypothetical protein